MTCRQCARALTRRQIRRGSLRCSHACANAAQRREYPQRSCERCQTPLTRRQLQDSQRFCSHRCAQLRSPRVARLPADTDHGCGAVLAVLEANRAWWLTYSDLAIWCHGDDGPAEINAIRSTMSRLRKLGYHFHTRRVGWPTLERWWITGVKLADEPARRTEEAA